MKKLMLIALAIMVAFAVPAFAEVQNVKVGGDISVKFIKSSNLDLNDAIGSANTLNATNAQLSSDHYFNTVTRLYVSADLTDNVQAYVRLINERDWDAQDNIGNGNIQNSDVAIDLSYIKLSEFLYSPLTLTIGRQEIWWGSAMVVGTGNNGFTAVREGYLSPQYAFDAVRATLNYDPWTIDMFWARIDEDEDDGLGVTPTIPTIGGDEEDEDLAGINVSYVWPSEWLTEGYYVFNSDGDTSNANAFNSKVHTMGIRAEGKVTPIDERLYLEAELAYQWGDRDANNDIKAWAGTVGATYSFDNKYKPVVGLKYDYRSGEEANNTDSDYETWNATYNYNLIGFLIDKIWLRDMYGNTAADTRGAMGNIHAVTTSGSFFPFEDIEVSLDWIWAQADEAQFANDDDDIGNELIGKITYDYTEDVKFKVMGAYFNPEDVFRAAEDDDAYEIISSVSVEF